jgi:hypothetical protein
MPAPLAVPTATNAGLAPKRSSPPPAPPQVGNVQAAGISNWYVGVTDAASGALIAEAGYQDRCFVVPGTEAVQQAPDYKWHGDSFVAATWHNTRTSLLVASLGFNVLYTDLDVVWLADPLELIARWAPAGGRAPRCAPPAGLAAQPAAPRQRWGKGSLLDSRRRAWPGRQRPGLGPAAPRTQSRPRLSAAWPARPPAQVPPA